MGCNRDRNRGCSKGCSRPLAGDLRSPSAGTARALARIMIITKATAHRLALQGNATIENCTVTLANGRTYVLVTRHDVQRVDHYRVG